MKKKNSSSKKRLITQSKVRSPKRSRLKISKHKLVRRTIHGEQVRVPMPPRAR